MDDINVLKEYQALSYELNAILWQGDELKGALLVQAQRLDQAIARWQSEAPITLYRGGTWRLGNRARGDIITIPAFTSTTRHIELTKQFMPSDCLPAARFTIYCPAGIHFAPISELDGLASDESEVLLARGLRCRVEDVQRITEPSQIQTLVGPNFQGVHTEVWDVTLTVLASDR